MASSLLTLRSIPRQITIIASSSSKLISAPMVGGIAWINTKTSPDHNNNKNNAEGSSKTGISPLLMLPPAIEEEGKKKKKKMVYKLYSLAEKRVVSLGRKDDHELAQELDDELVVGSSHGWLATYNKRNHDLFLSNPNTSQHHHPPIKLPSLLTLPTAKQHLAVGPDSRCVERVLVSSRPDHEEEDCRVICETNMTSYPVRHGDAGLAFCCPTRSTEWTPIGGGLYPNYRAYAYSTKHKLLFCLTSFGMIEVWDLRDLQYPRVCLEEEEDHLSTKWKKVRPRSEEEKLLRRSEVCRRCWYLVFSEQSDQLFLVTRHIMERAGPDGSYVEEILVGPKRNVHLDKTLVDKTFDFDVEKITGWESSGEEITKRRDESLNGGLSFFIGKNNCVVLPTDEFPGLEPDSIYFTDDEVNNYSTDRDTGHVSIFNYPNRTLSPFYYPCDRSQGIKSIVPSAMWFTPSSPL